MGIMRTGTDTSAAGLLLPHHVPDYISERILLWEITILHQPHSRGMTAKILLTQLPYRAPLRDLLQTYTQILTTPLPGLCRLHQIPRLYRPKLCPSKKGNRSRHGRTSRMPLHSMHLRHTATAIPVQAVYPRRAQAGQARSIRDGTSIQGIRNINAAGRGYTIKKAPTP